MADKPVDIAKEILEGAVAVRLAGLEISRRIEKLEAWLNKLPGRVEASCELYSHGDSTPEGRYLGLSKDGKTWSLRVFTFDPVHEQLSDSVLLRDAGMSDKMVAVRSFPKLLEAMAGAQKSLVREARESIAKFDKLAEDLKIGEGA